MSTFLQTHFNLLLDAIQVWHVALTVIGLFVILLVKAVKLTTSQTNLNANILADEDWNLNSALSQEYGSVNPATGLPMVGTYDTGGNAYGSGTYHH